MTTYKLCELADLLSCRYSGDSEFVVDNYNVLDHAQSSDISFLSNDSYIEAAKVSKAGVICIDEKHLHLCPGFSTKNFLIFSENPSQYFQKIAEFFSKKLSREFCGIHETAIVSKSAKIADNVTIGPYSIVSENVHIGSGVYIGSHCFIGSDVKIGKDSFIKHRVTIESGSICGERLIFQSGVVVGSCGFGYHTDKTFTHTKIEHLGNVEIGNDVEIGANATVNRARFKGSTKVGSGTKIGDLVTIAHNVKIGENCLVIAQVGIAGSAELGDRVVIGGQTGIVGHIKVDSDIMVAAQSGITKTHKKIAGKKTYLIGAPAVPKEKWYKRELAIREFVRSRENKDL